MRAKDFAKRKTPSRPCSAREGVLVFGAPSSVLEGGRRLTLPRFQSCIESLPYYAGAGLSSIVPCSTTQGW